MRGTSRATLQEQGTIATHPISTHRPPLIVAIGIANLVEVDHGLPEPAGLLVEIPHTNFTEVTRMVFVHVGPVVMQTTGQTTTTRIYLIDNIR